MTRLFRLNKRTYQNKVVFYASFPIPTGGWSPRKSTGCDTRTKAEKWAHEQLSNGRAQGIASGNMTLQQWVTGFWGVNGTYAEKREARGFSVSPGYLENQRRNLENYVLKKFGKKRLYDLTTEVLEKYFFGLYKSGLAGNTVNGIMRALRVPLREAERFGLIAKNPMVAVPQMSAKGRERGVLEQDELDRLFAEDCFGKVWTDRQSMILAMLAAGCGLRHGEARAVGPMDIANGILTVSRQWDRHGGSFREPKCGSFRQVPVPARVLVEIEILIREKQIPDEGVLSAGNIPIRPRERVHYELAALREALVKIGIPIEEQRRRYLDLHALRHTYVTRLRAGDVPDWQIMAVAGHKSLNMTNRYTHGKGSDYADVAAQKIIPFAKKAG